MCFGRFFPVVAYVWDTVFIHFTRLKTLAVQRISQDKIHVSKMQRRCDIQHASMYQFSKFEVCSIHNHRSVKMRVAIIFEVI